MDDAGGPAEGGYHMVCMLFWFLIGGFAGLVAASFIAAAGRADRCEECWLRGRNEHE